jgi:hypothetical protein
MNEPSPSAVKRLNNKELTRPVWYGRFRAGQDEQRMARRLEIPLDISLKQA